MLSIISILFIIVKVVVAFSALIILHELGHFIVAKISGVWVEEFGIGLPPRIVGIKIGGTLYSINWLPVGGFVKLHGETAGDQVLYPDRAFTNKRKTTKILITLAGIAMNFILAIVCFAIVYSVVGIETSKIDVTVEGVTANSPAAAAGLQANDIVKKVDDTSVTSTTQFQSVINNFKGKAVEIDVLRSKDIKALNITPRANPPVGEGPLGVEISDVPEIYFPPIWQRPFVGAWYGLKQAIILSKAVIFGLGSAAQSVGKGQAPKGVVGVIGIFALFVEFAKLGILPIINLVGVISINLAIINIIPFPPLDGSRVAIAIAEWITRRKITPDLENKIYLAGMIILLSLMVLITAREVPQLIKSGSLSKFAGSILNQK